MTLISLVVLTHNSSEYIQKCIESITVQDYEKFELIIVDNCSNDGTRQLLSSTKISMPKDVRIILHSKNVGYNTGNMIGIQNARGDFIAIINPDVVLEKSWLSKIISTMQRENYDIAGGKLFNVDGTLQSLGGLIDIYGAVEQLKTKEADGTRFFYNSGSAFVFKKNILSKIKFDPNLFMYYEDVDLAWQSRLLGLKTGFCEDANAVHIGGHSQPGLPPEKFYHISKNRIYVCLKNYSTNRILKRVYKILFLILLDSIYYSFNFKSSRYFLMMLKAMMWNLLHIKQTSKKRKEIQQRRIVSDNEIEKFMEKHSIEFKILNKKKQ